MEPSKPVAIKRDNGLQPERTSLAWTRTIYVIVLDSLLFLRVGLTKHLPLIVGAGVVLLCLAVMVAIGRKYRVLDHMNDSAGLANRSRVFGAVSLTLLAVAGMLCFSVIFAA